MLHGACAIETFGISIANLPQSFVTTLRGPLGAPRGMKNHFLRAKPYSSAISTLPIRICGKELSSLSDPKVSNPPHFPFNAVTRKLRNASFSKFKARAFSFCAGDIKYNLTE
jgi:hypothetical protein